MECGDNAGVLGNVKVEITEADLCQDGLATELTLELVPVLRVKQEIVPEENAIGEDILSSQSPRLTSEGVSQDGTGTCTSLALSNQGHNQVKVLSNFKTTSESAVLRKSSRIQNKCPFNCDSSHACEHHSENSESSSELVGDKRINEGKGVYKCEFCVRSYRCKSRLMQHVVIHFDARPYKCKICKKGFKHKGNLKIHGNCQSGIKPYKCDRCGESFKWKYCLHQHIMLHSDITP